MSRHALRSLVILFGIALATPALATVGPPVSVRWSGEWPAPARRGAETAGRFEILAGDGCTIQDLSLEGPGWSIRELGAPRTLVLPARARRSFAFRAVPEDPAAPLVVVGTVNGVPFRKVFRLDAQTLSTIGRRDPLVLDRVETHGPATGKGAPPTTNGISYRFRGRIVYPRNDALVVGADNIVVKIMDADPAPVYEEMMGFTLTDHEGNFDFTLEWIDIDGATQDLPDIFLLVEAANVKVHVRADATYDLQDWSSEASPIIDYTGSDLSFGTVTLDVNAQAAHIFTSIVKADRHAREQGGMDAPLVYVHWPDSTGGAYYSSAADEIHIGTSSEWNEGTHVHEFGHHLQSKFSVLNPSDYDNDFCDQPGRPGHCLWCPENETDAWQEGWCNWFASRMMRVWEGAYGYQPLAFGDDRWDLESTDFCSDDAQFYPQSDTEGFVGALLRDIEDSFGDGFDGYYDCSRDVLSMGDAMIFLIFRDDDPETVWDFINAYRARNSHQDMNLWHTIEHVAPSLNFPRPALAVTSQPPACRAERLGTTIQLSVASNSAMAHYEWRRNGTSISGYPGTGYMGTGSKTLTIGPLTALHAGRYDCVITACDGTQEVMSSATELDVVGAGQTGPLVSWGVNGNGTVGNGTTSWSSPPYRHTELADLVEVEGGHPHTVGLAADGQVWTWGFSNVGELGRGSWYGPGYTPAPILSGVVDIAAGTSFGLALEADGRIRSWGSNFYGQLFTGNRNDANSPGFTIDVGCVRQVAAGAAHSLALLEDGTIRGVGYNAYGNLGVNTTTTMELTPQQPIGLGDVIAIDAADYWSMALRADGTVWTWGINTQGQLGLGHYNSVAVPTQVPGLSGIARIWAGQLNGYALGADGRLWAWGYGTALGIGWNGGSATSPQLVPLTNVSKLVAGASWAMALVDGRIKAWGLNANVTESEGGLFNAVTPYGVPSPMTVPGIVNATDLFGGWTTAHALGELEGVGVGSPGVGVPRELALAATPNPSRENAALRFDLPVAGRVTLAVYDAAGRRLRTLADEDIPAGSHVRPWDGTNDAGARTAAGVYFVRLSAPGGRLTRAIVRTE